MRKLIYLVSYVALTNFESFDNKFNFNTKDEYVQTWNSHKILKIYIYIYITLYDTHFYWGNNSTYQTLTNQSKFPT